MVNHIISEWNKIAWKEYKTSHDWVGKVIHWELCKWLKFDNTTKWYMHKLNFVQENETHKILCDFEIQTDHLIIARWPGLPLFNKKKDLSSCGFCSFFEPQSENKRKQRKYLDLAGELKKAIENEDDGDTNRSWCTWNGF